jgi:addiction module HigA family antidote
MRKPFASKTITRDPSELGVVVSPGEMLLEEFMRPLGVKQTDLAADLGVSLNRLNEIVLGKRGITADTALRLARRFKTSHRPPFARAAGCPASSWGCRRSRG